MRMPVLQIMLYYLFFLPNVLVLTIPFAVMLGILYELGNLGRHNELSALRASGIKLVRIVSPLIIVAILLSILILTISETVLPTSTYQSEKILSLYEEQSAQKNADSIKDVTFYNIEDQYIIFIKELHSENRSASGMLIKELFPDGSLKKIIRAKRAKWLDGYWWLFNGSITRYTKGGHISSEIEHFIKRETAASEAPEEIAFQKKEIENMNFFSYLKYLKKQFGKNIPRDKLVDLYYKLSFPFVTLIISLLVVPFAMRIKKGGMLSALGWGIGLALLFYGLILISLALGKQGYLPGSVAAWLPHIVFGTAGLVLLFRTS
jgi:lipopolysaccharide export system permease protein